jgi:hypothetical protein
MFEGEFELFEFVGVSLWLEFELSVGGHDLFNRALGASGVGDVDVGDFLVFVQVVFYEFGFVQCADLLQLGDWLCDGL